MRERTINAVHRVPGERGGEVRVYVCGGAQLAMPEQLLDDAELDVLREQIRGTSVASIVEPLVGQAKPPDVSRRLGHADVGITMRVYAHSLREGDGHIARAIEAALRTG